MFDLKNLLRENVKGIVPAVRNTGAGLHLDTNENNFGSPVDGTLNRYPDPKQQELRRKIGAVKGLPAEHIFLGNGSYEVTDLLMRAVCRPGVDNIVLLPPAWSAYHAIAQLNDVFVKTVPLDEQFQPDIEGISEVIDDHTKLLFLCSPNDPTGNSMDREAVEMILNNFHGLVVMDEAYVNYSRQKSFIAELTEYPNLVVLQTLSKAWGLAGLRIGMAFGSSELVEVLDKIRAPFNVSEASQLLALQALDKVEQVNWWIKETVNEREKLRVALGQLPVVKFIYPSDANFLLVKVSDAEAVCSFLAARNIIVRDFSKMIRCENCLRITVGTPEEHATLLDALNEIPA